MGSDQAGWKPAVQRFAGCKDRRCRWFGQGWGRRRRGAPGHTGCAGRGRFALNHAISAAAAISGAARPASASMARIAWASSRSHVIRHAFAARGAGAIYPTSRALRWPRRASVRRNCPCPDDARPMQAGRVSSLRRHGAFALRRSRAGIAAATIRRRYGAVRIKTKGMVRNDANVVTETIAAISLASPPISRARV